MVETLAAGKTYSYSSYSRLKKREPLNCLIALGTHRIGRGGGGGADLHQVRKHIRLAVFLHFVCPKRFLFFIILFLASFFCLFNKSAQESGEADFHKTVRALSGRPGGIPGPKCHIIARRPSFL